MNRLLSRAESWKRIGLLISLLALALGLFFSFYIYPRIAEPYTVVLDTDRYEPLAMGLWKNGTLSYYPDVEPTVERGPAYPAFLAGLLILSRGLYPESIWLGQSVLFALTCMLVFWISKSLWGKRTAIVASTICAINPFVFWYASRVWIESSATFLFTGLIASAVYLFLKPSTPRAILVGVIAGILALAKATFLPVLFVIPFLTWLLKSKQIRLPLWMIAASGLVVIPWLLRDYSLTGRLLPVQVLAGYNFQRGDSYLEHWSESPFSIRGLWESGSPEIDSLVSGVPQSLPRCERECITDSIWLQSSLEKYVRSPGFFFKKVALNMLSFWTLGETILKSSVISLCTLPLLGLFAGVVVRMIRLKKVAGVHIIILSLASIYFLVHLPIMAFARLSVVIVPTLSIYAASALSGAFSVPTAQSVTATDARHPAAK